MAIGQHGPSFSNDQGSGRQVGYAQGRPLARRRYIVLLAALSFILTLAGSYGSPAGATHFEDDDSPVVQQMIDAASAGSTVRLDAGTYRFYHTVRGKSGVSIECAPGAVVERPREAERESTGQYHRLLTLYDVSDVSVTGCTFEGNADDQPVYSEFDHSVSIRDSSNVSITNNTFLDSPGDGVYLGASQAITPPKCNSDVTVSSNDFRGANRGRQAVSIICGKRIKILDNTVNNYTRKGMPGAVDLEPNRAEEFFADIVVDGNKIYNLNAPTRQYSGIMLHNGAGGSVNNVDFTNNLVQGSMSAGIVVRTPGSSGKQVEVSRNTVLDINGEISPYSSGVRMIGGSGTLVAYNTISNIAGKCIETRDGSKPLLRQNSTSNCLK